MHIVNPGEVPIKTVTRESVAFPSHWVAKSAVRFRNWSGNVVMVHGFSFRSSKDDAIKVSRMEVFERLYAQHDFVGRDFLEWKLWPHGEQSGFIPSGDVLLGQVPNPSVHKLDASGLSWHRTIHEAEEHAVQEVIERHLLCRWWYGDLGLTLIGERQLISNRYYLEQATVDCGGNIPFAISILYDRAMTSWVCGSAVCSTLGSAMEKSKNEALMLMDGVTHNDSSVFNPNEGTKEVLLSLGTASISKNRDLFFRESVRSGEKFLPSVNKKIFLEEICRLVFGGVPIIKSILIRTSNEGSLVRVLCSEALKVKEERVRSSLNRPPDPFC